VQTHEIGQGLSETVSLLDKLRMAGIIDRLRHPGVRYQFHVSLLPGRLAQGADEHLDIIGAVISGDPVAAERITRDHFASVIGCLHQLEDVARPSILPAV
jgi:DNA-binding GntR family transcriptional regulator